MILWSFCVRRSIPPATGQSDRNTSLSGENFSGRSLSIYRLMQHERELRENSSNPMCVDQCEECEDGLLLEPADRASWRSTEEHKTTFADLLGRADLIKRAADRKIFKGLQLKTFDDDNAKSAAQDQLRSSKICNQKPRRSPSWKSSPENLTKMSLLEPRSGCSNDGDESLKSSSEGRDLAKFIEAPRISVDGRESPAANAKTSVRISSSHDFPGKPPERHPARLLLDTSKQLPMQINSSEPAKEKCPESKRKSSNVVARLMGLEEMPEQMLHHQSKLCQKIKSCTEEVSGQSLSQARQHSHESYGSGFLHQTLEEFWQNMKSDRPRITSTAAGLNRLLSDRKNDADFSHGEIGLGTAFPPRHLSDIMPHHLKQNNDLKHSTKPSNISLGAKQKQCKKKSEFDGCIHRSQDVVVDSLRQSRPIQGQGGHRKSEKQMTEVNVRRKESETSARAESKVRKSDRKNALFAAQIHSPKSRKAEMEDRLTGKISAGAPKNSSDPFDSNPADIVASTPSICHKGISTKSVGKIESLSDSDASATRRSSKRTSDNGQKVGPNIKTSDRKNLDQTMGTQGDAQIPPGTQQTHQKMKMMVRATAMTCSNSPRIKPTATKSASGRGSNLSSKNSDFSKGPNFLRARQSNQISPEKEKKFSFSNPPQESEATMIMDLRDRKSVAETAAETAAETEFYPQKRIPAEDGGIAMPESSGESIRFQEVMLLENSSDADYGVHNDAGKISSRFGLTEMATELEQEKKVEGEEGRLSPFPANDLQETEKHTSKTNVSENWADEGEVDQACVVIQRCFNEHVKAFEHTKCFGMEAATPPDSPSSMNCEPERHDFMENGFGETPDHPSPLSVLDASSLLDACSPDLHNTTQNTELSEFGLDDHLVRCRKFRSSFAMDRSPPRESTNRALKSKKTGTAEYVDKVEVGTPRIQPRHLPINKHYFDMIDKEIAYSIDWRIGDGETRHEHSRKSNFYAIPHRLLVDCVTDIVENKLLPNLDWTILSKDQRDHVLRLVYHEIQQLFSQPSQKTNNILPSSLEADISLDWHSCSLKSEILDLVNRVEALIFKQLVDESLLELIILSTKKPGFQLTFRS